MADNSAGADAIEVLTPKAIRILATTVTVVVAFGVWFALARFGAIGVNQDVFLADPVIVWLHNVVLWAVAIGGSAVTAFLARRGGPVNSRAVLCAGVLLTLVAIVWCGVLIFLVLIAGTLAALAYGFLPGTACLAFAVGVLFAGLRPPGLGVLASTLVVALGVIACAYLVAA